MLGLILILKNEYEITSNNFAGKGRYDLLLKPKNILEGKEEIIIELKIVNGTENLSNDKKGMWSCVESNWWERI